MSTLKEKKSLHVGRLVGGIICLAIGAFLGLLTFILPEDQLMFTIGDENLPMVPALILAAVGIWLIATSKQAKEESMPVDPEKARLEGFKNEESLALNKRLETVGWGLFLIMLGGFAFIPHEQIPQGAWSVGVGVIMLGLNATRYYYGIKMSGFTTFLGIFALISGIGELLGLYDLDGALLLIILGAYLILKPWFEKKKLFG